ncbi:2-amino-4-deoxychorismate dehydrogenase [Sporomusa rhizae]|uniref:flavodoxin family protein n=1 Tax=Sporomusa rhizae TaxID=357999 RepID=UPI00352AED5B
MKILGINGSARVGGNTEIVLSNILMAAEKLGAATEYIAIDKLKIQGCKGCLWCQNKETGRCVQRDDMVEVYDKVASADIVVFASPVYFSTMTGQLKTFIDRLYPFYGRGGKPSRLPKQIQAALIFTQGQPDDLLYSQSFAIAANSLRQIGFKVKEDVLVTPGIPNLGDVLKSEPLLNKARLFGESLLQKL